KISNAVCKAFNATCEIEFVKDVYPITVNHPKVTQRVFSSLGNIPGTRVIETEPILAGEDFSRFLQKAPGTFYFLGTRNPRKGCISPNHSSNFKLDEEVMKFGAVSLAKLALEFG